MSTFKIGDKIKYWIVDEYGNTISFNAIIVSNVDFDIYDLNWKLLFKRTRKTPITTQ